MLAAILVPVYARSADREYQAHAQERVDSAAATLLAYRDQHGRCPESLTEAISPAPVDPFSQKPLVYRRTGAGFILYSVGAGGHYDGAVLPEKDRNTETSFRYPA